MTEKVIIGENHSGICAPKALRTIMLPKNKIEYIAPFCRYLYFFILLIFPMVICLTINAPKPFPIKIIGIDKVKQKLQELHL